MNQAQWKELQKWNWGSIEVPASGAELRNEVVVVVDTEYEQRLVPVRYRYAMLSRSVMFDSLQPVDCSPAGSSVHGDSPGKNTGVGFYTLLQGIFPTQGSNPGPPHCRQILYCLNHHGSPQQGRVCCNFSKEKWVDHHCLSSRREFYSWKFFPFSS